LLHRDILVATFGGVPNKYVGASTRLFFQYINGLLHNGHKVIHCVFTTDIVKAENEVKEYLNQLNNQSVTVHIIDVMSEDSSISMIDELSFDIILCFDITTAKFFEKYSNKKKILWLGDLQYLTLYYHYYYYVKGNFFHIFKAPVVFFKIIKQLLEYKKYCRQFDLIIVSSYSSVRRLKLINIKNKIKYLPYPWLLDKSVDLMSIDKFKIATFLFLGTLNALGSKSAFDFIANRLYIKLVNKFGKNKFKILISGSGELPIWFKIYAQNKKELEYVGFVDDLDKLICQCHGAVIPVDVPVGNRSRIVTCFGLKIPVIAHKNTALGNPSLKHKYNCYLADNPNDFAQYMYDIYKKPHDNMVHNAFYSYKYSFDPKYAIDQLMYEIKNI
jgi:hypothetical protein